MGEGQLFLLIPVLALATGLAAVIGHHISNYHRMKHGFAPVNSDGKAQEGVSTEWQQLMITLKADVDRLKAIELENDKLKQRIATLEKIVTDPTNRLASEIERLG
jgi:hypothetical protein